VPHPRVLKAEKTGRLSGSDGLNRPGIITQSRRDEGQEVLWRPWCHVHSSPTPRLPSPQQVLSAVQQIWSEMRLHNPYPHPHTTARTFDSRIPTLIPHSGLSPRNRHIPLFSSPAPWRTPNPTWNAPPSQTQTPANVESPRDVNTLCTRCVPGLAHGGDANTTNYAALEGTVLAR